MSAARLLPISETNWLSTATIRSPSRIPPMPAGPLEITLTISRYSACVRNSTPKPYEVSFDLRHRFAVLIAGHKSRVRIKSGNGSADEFVHNCLRAHATLLIQKTSRLPGNRESVVSASHRNVTQPLFGLQIKLLMQTPLKLSED